MRIYPHGLCIRNLTLQLLKIYSSDPFVNGKNKERYDRLFIHLLMGEFIGRNEIENGLVADTDVVNLIKSMKRS